MRVQLIRARKGDQSGAIAVLASVLSVALLVVAAFTVDFGAAYNSKVRLQVAADSGALAAAQVYKWQTAKCQTLKTEADLTEAAQKAADKWAAQNRAGDTTGSPVKLECNSDGELTLDYATSGSSRLTFGVLATGGSDSVSTSRQAQATIGRVPAGGLRPWGVCSNVVTTATNGEVIFVPMEGSSTSTQDADTLCGPDKPPGGWWVAQCTGQGNGNGETESTVEQGCGTTGYKAVPGQPTTGDPVALYNYLTGYCPSKSANETCLSSDQGNNFHNTSDEWQELVGQTFTMPVFCVKPSCKALAVSGGGNNASYAVYGLAEVELCGLELQPRAPSTGWPTEGPCATSNPKGYAAGDVTNGGGLFVVVKRLYSGPVGDWMMPEYRRLRLTR